MGGVLALLGGAAALLFGAPVLLSRARWSTRRPMLALSLWCGSFACGLLAAVSSLGVALSIGLAAYEPGSEARSRVVATTAILLFSWAGLVGVGGLLSLVAIRSEPMTTDHRQTAMLMNLLVSASAYRREVLGRVTVVYVNSDRPVAVSLPGRQPRIVVASRLEDELSGRELRAVIEHERAHLVQRHGRIIQLAQLNAACLPVLPGARQFHRAARLLVELIADDAAARVCGPDDLARALVKLGTLTEDEGMQLRAQRIASAPCGTYSPARLGERGKLSGDRARRPVQDGEPS